MSTSTGVRAALVAVVALCASCIGGSGATECESGVVCPRGTVCDDQNATCVPQGQLTACDGLADGELCTFLEVGGVCSGGVCRTEVCGNGVVDPTEECDCGDGAFLPAGCGSQNSDTAGAECKSDCTAHCGDGMVNSIEQCELDVPPDGVCLDFGFDRGALACTASCESSLDACGRIGFTPVAVPGLINLFAAASESPGGRRFVVGSLLQAGVIVQFDGASSTTRVADRPLHDVLALADDDVWAVGDGGTALHFDGTEWTDRSAGINAASNLRRLFSGNGELFAASDQYLHRFDGASWKVDFFQSAPFGYALIGGIWPDAMFAKQTTIVPQIKKRVGENDWQLISEISAVGQDSEAGTINEIIAHDGAVYFFGNGGSSYVYEPAAGQPWQSGFVPTANDLVAAWSSGTHLYVSSASELFVFDGTSWLAFDVTEFGAVVDVTGRGTSPVLLSNLPSGLFDLVTFHGSVFAEGSQVGDGASQELRSWVASRSAIFHFGSGPTVNLESDAGVQTYTPGTVNTRILGLWGTSEVDVYAVGLEDGLTRVAFHFNGATWSPLAALPQSTDPYKRGCGEIVGDTNSVYVSCATGEVLRYQFGSQTWSSIEELAWLGSPGIRMSVNADGLFAAVADSTEVRTSVSRFDGTAWQYVFESQAPALSFYAASSTSIHIGSFGGLLLHYDGATITEQYADADDNIASMHGTGPDDVFAVQASRAVYHFAGKRWAPIRAPRLAYFHVFATPELVHFLDFIGPTAKLIRTEPW